MYTTNRLIYINKIYVAEEIFCWIAKLYLRFIARFLRKVINYAIFYLDITKGSEYMQVKPRDAASKLGKLIFKSNFIFLDDMLI